MKIAIGVVVFIIVAVLWTRWLERFYPGPEDLS